MSTVQGPWISASIREARIRELEAENIALREQVKRREGQIAAVWAVVRESQRISLSVTSNSDILDALGTP